MTEIKAFLRPECMDPVVHALIDAGVASISVVPVKAVGTSKESARIDPTFFARYAGVHKLELVCDDEDADHLLHLIVSLGHTGQSGDGLVYASTVDRVIKIRSGAEGRKAVDKCRPR